MRAVSSQSLLLTTQLYRCATRGLWIFLASNGTRIFHGAVLGRHLPPGVGRRGDSAGQGQNWNREKIGRWEEDRPPPSVLPSSSLLTFGGSSSADGPPPPAIPFPKEIVSFLDEFVVGQTLAKKTLAVGVYQHYKRVEFNRRASQLEDRDEFSVLMKHAIQREAHSRREKEAEQPAPRHTAGFSLSRDPKDDVVMDKSNIVLLGPSGSGKTYLTTRLAQALNVPIALCDCTTLTQAGYVGEDVESVVQKLFVNANGDIEATERGIVFLDEFDKIYTSSDPVHTSSNRDVNGRGVQQALLKLVEGTKCLVKNPFVPNQKVEIDTSDVLFVASGAFAGLDRVVARRLDRRTLGYAARDQDSHHLAEALESHDEEEVAAARKGILAATDQNDLIQFGMVPELVGRFPVLVPFDQLDEKQLREVLVRPRNNIITQTKELFRMDGIELEFTECAIEEMAHLAVRRKTGARALRSILERALLPAKYECPGSPMAFGCRIVISGAVIRGELPFECVAPRTVVAAPGK